MAQQRGWNPIYAPNMDAGGGRQFDAGNQTINRGFEGLIGTLDTVQSNEKTRNTNAYLNKIAELGQTPEQLQGAMQSGQLAQFKASLGSNIDEGATRGAAENLLGQRYQQVKAANEFSDAKITREQLPMLDQISSMIANKNTAGAEALLAQNPQLRNKTALYQGITNRNRLNTTESQADTKFGFDVTKEGRDALESKDRNLAAIDQLRHTKVVEKNAAAQLGISQGNLDLNKANAADQRIEKLSGILQKNMSEAQDTLGAAGNNTVGSLKGAEDLTKQIKSLYPDQKVFDSVMATVSKLSAENPKLPVSAMIAAAAGAKDDRWRFFKSLGINNNSTAGEDSEERMRTMLKSTGVLEQMSTAEDRKLTTQNLIIGAKTAKDTYDPVIQQKLARDLFGVNLVDNVVRKGDRNSGSTVTNAQAQKLLDAMPKRMPKNDSYQEDSQAEYSLPSILRKPVK